MSPLQLRPLAVTDFSGGITDNFINAPLNRAEEMDNFLIRPNKSIQSRSGSHVEDLVNAQIPTGAQVINAYINYDRDDTLFVLSADRIFFRDPAAYTTLTGPSGNQLWPAATTTLDHTSYTQWKKHIFLANDSFASPKKIYKDSGGTFRLRTAGLPALASSPVVTPSVAGVQTFTYAFLHFYEYTAGAQTFQDFGPVTLVEVTLSSDPSVNQNDITVIPVLANGSDENWDTTVIKIKIYRTVNAGSVLFEIGEVTNGTTTFTDNFADSTIDDNATIYTTDGSLDNDPPPTAKFVHIVGNIGYYAHTKEGADTLPNDIRQSVPGDPDSCPASLRDTVEDEIKGMSSIQSIPMVFCRSHIYRLEGLFDAQGRGSIEHVRIDDTAGCVSHLSIVQAEDMVFWAGNDGFYASDGYKVFHLTDHFNDRYKALIDNLDDPSQVYGAYDETNGRILWATQKDTASNANDIIFILDLRWGISRNSSFTTFSGGASFRPTAIAFFSNELFRGDTRGYTFVHSDTDLNDPLIDTSQLPANWDTQTVIWLYKGMSTNFGSTMVRKWVPRLKVNARNVSNVTIGLSAINDDNDLERVMTPIRYRANFVWGEPEFVWGDPDFVWNSAGLIEAQRKLPKVRLRCSYMQIKITNADAIITNSDTLGTAGVVAATKLITLDTAANAWPLNVVGYDIAFVGDNYTQKFEVTDQISDTVIEVLDPQSLLTDLTATKWQLSGIRKNEVLNLLGYTLSYGFLTRTQSHFTTGEAGANV